VAAAAEELLRTLHMTECFLGLAGVYYGMAKNKGCGIAANARG
jgi:hypothetical protein